MKIGLVLSRPPVYSETFLNLKILGLINNGIDVELFVNNNDPGFKICPQNALPKNHFYGLWALINTILLHPFRVLNFLSKEINDGKPVRKVISNLYSNLHLLNSSNLSWLHFSFLTTTIGRENIASVLNVKMGVSIRGYDISRYPINHPLAYRNTWKKIDKLHYLSEALLNKAYSEGLEDTSAIPCVKITPAIDIIVFNHSPKTYKFSNPVKFLTIARLHWSKGLDHTLQALYYLHKSGIDFKYTIIGDGSELERLTYTCYLYGISEKVNFIGKVKHENLKTYYEDCNIYLQYSIQEGFCNAVLEAQAMGLPCIVSDAEGLPENIINNTTGWVVPSCKPHLLANKISEVLKTDPVEISAICKVARKRIKNNFNIQKQEQEFVKFFTE